MAQSNPLSQTEILEDAVIRIKEHSTVQGFSYDTNGLEVRRESRDIEEVMKRKGRCSLGDSGSLNRARVTITDADIKNGGIRMIGGKDGGSTDHVTISDADIRNGVPVNNP